MNPESVYDFEKQLWDRIMSMVLDQTGDINASVSTANEVVKARREFFKEINNDQ